MRRENSTSVRARTLLPALFVLAGCFMTQAADAETRATNHVGYGEVVRSCAGINFANLFEISQTIAPELIVYSSNRVFSDKNSGFPEIHTPVFEELTEHRFYIREKDSGCAFVFLGSGLQLMTKDSRQELYIENERDPMRDATVGYEAVVFFITPHVNSFHRADARYQELAFSRGSFVVGMYNIIEDDMRFGILALEEK